MRTAEVATGNGPFPDTCDVLVVGGGVSGLSAAWHLLRENPALDVHVVDIADRVGGKLRAATLAGIPIDIGAEAILTRRPEAVGLIDALGLNDQMRFPGTLGAKIALVDGQHAMPMTTMGIPTDIASLESSGLLSERGVRTLRNRSDVGVLTEDTSVAEAIGSRLGPEVVDRLVEPMLGGVYAGRADRLSLEATMPALYERMREQPDVIEAAKVLRPPKPVSGTALPVFTTLVNGGVSRLPEAIVHHAGVQVHLRCPARALRRTENGFAVEVGTGADPHVIDATSVVIATGPSKAAQLLSSVLPQASAALCEIPTASMAVVAVAYRTSDLAGPIPDGSGFLVPVSLGTAIKAATYVSNKWPHLVTGDAGAGEMFIVRASIGRIGEEAILQRPDDELVALARRDLALLAGVSGEPVDVAVQRWGGALPQYNVGHRARVARVQEAAAEFAGIAIAGATYQGVGIPACIASGKAAADKVLRKLHR